MTKEEIITFIKECSKEYPYANSGDTNRFKWTVLTDLLYTIYYSEQYNLKFSFNIFLDIINDEIRRTKENIFPNKSELYYQLFQIRLDTLEEFKALINKKYLSFKYKMFI